MYFIWEIYIFASCWILYYFCNIKNTNWYRYLEERWKQMAIWTYQPHDSDIFSASQSFKVLSKCILLFSSCQYLMIPSYHTQESFQWTSWCLLTVPVKRFNRFTKRALPYISSLASPVNSVKRTFICDVIVSIMTVAVDWHPFCGPLSYFFIPVWDG